MVNKPHLGRIKNWKRHQVYPRTYVIVGEFLDHPCIRGGGHTSAIVKHDQASGEVETINSRYTLVDSGEPTRFPGFPFKGDFMVFRGAGGYPFELEDAKKIFKHDEIYEVEDCEVVAFNHTVKFVGIDGRWNGVMFERVLE